MSVQERETTRDTGPAVPPLIHYYPADPAYRLSGMEPPQVGDIARCGHRKALPPSCPPPGHDCVVCLHLFMQAKRFRA